MAIYTPDYFRGDQKAAMELVASHPFATLMTVIDHEEPQLTYLPLQVEDKALWGHMAKSNPHWRRFAQGRTYAMFHGPHAYISPSWYPSPAENVPTWNYAVVHFSGSPEILNQAGTLRVVKQLVSRFEPDGGATSAEKVEKLLGGIVGFRMPILRVEAKFKMSQNKPEAERAALIGGLRSRGQAAESAVADWMEQHGSAPQV